MTRLALLGLFALLTACGGSGSDRVLLVGIDGANLRVIAPLLERGRLPNLGRIAKEGASGPMRSELPLLSPRIWNTIATGKAPNQHGIGGFALESKGEKRLLNGSDRRVHALWNIASASGRSVGVVNWWNTFPPEIVNGVIVSDHARSRKAFELGILTGINEVVETPTVFPRDWEARVKAELERTDAPVSVSDPFAEGQTLPSFANRKGLSRFYQEDAGAFRVALQVEAVLRPDLLMVFLPGIDRVSHSLWGVMEPPELYPPRLRPTSEEREGGRLALERYYEYTDAMLGLLLERYTPNDLVVVVSDHGFEAGVALKNLSGTHESEGAIDGILFARGPGIEPGSNTAGATIYDVLPTVLSWWNLPLADDMPGAPASFLPERMRERVASYDTAPIQRMGSESSGREEEILDQLRDLGYLD